jgi:hypothetical protein
LKSLTGSRGKERERRGRVRGEREEYLNRKSG